MLRATAAIDSIVGLLLVDYHFEARWRWSRERSKSCRKAAALDTLFIQLRHRMSWVTVWVVIVSIISRTDVRSGLVNAAVLCKMP